MAHLPDGKNKWPEMAVLKGFKRPRHLFSIWPSARLKICIIPKEIRQMEVQKISKF